MTKPRIMVVDDSTLVLDVVGETLRSAGYEVLTRSVAVGTGAAILRERPVLALLDVSMPLMSGAEITQAVRSTSMARATWVVLHSDRPEAELEELAVRCGADGYLRKTSDPKVLLGAVHQWVSRGRPSERSGYILVACSASTRERIAGELQTSLPVRFTDSGADALRQITSGDTPTLVAVGTSVGDLSADAIYRSATRSHPSWKSRFLVIEEVETRGVTHAAAELPCWSTHDPVRVLAARLNALHTRN